MTTQASASTVVAANAADELEMLGIARGRYDLVPLDGVRRVVARRLTDAARDIPHFSIMAHLAAAPLLAARSRFGSGVADKVSVNDLIVATVAKALIGVPDANVSFSEHGIVRHHHADVAVAVSIPGGLITPIVRDAETKTVREISQEVRDLADRARRRRLKPDEYNGGSFCVSNLGMYGVSSFGSILNPPQGAILSVGAIEDRVVVTDGSPAVAKMMTVTLTCDHRVIDGATGARWLQAFAAAVADAAGLQ